MIRAGGGYTAEDMRTVLEVEHQKDTVTTAVEMNVSLSAVWKRVGRVERVLGVKLFNRASGRFTQSVDLTLTPGGTLILQAFARSLDDIEDAVTLAKRTRGE